MNSGEMFYDPATRARELNPSVSQGLRRRYYRLSRGARWYGGIATADCCGCNLKCVFCWSNYPRDHPRQAGKLYSPEQVFDSLTSCARRYGYSQLRVSGNEPTLNQAHLLGLLELVEGTDYRFVLETNGIPIDRDYARELAGFTNLHVRVSLKGASQGEFSRLTGAVGEAFSGQIEALRHLWDAGVSVHPAVMLSFSTEGSLSRLRSELRKIASALESELEEEYVLLYPHVLKRLKGAGLKPSMTYDQSSHL